MSTEVTKETIRMRLAELNLSVKEAIELLGMTRQNYNKHLAAPQLSQHFIRLFKEKIGLETKVAKYNNAEEPQHGHKHNKGDLTDLGDSYILYAPLVSSYAYAGYLAGYADAEFIEALPVVPWLVEKEHKGIYRSFDIRSDSMDDGTREGYIPGDRVLGREISKDFWKDKLHLKRWKDFIIVHRTDGILLKQIKQHDPEKGIITLHSLNPAYDDFEMNLKDVVQLFNVVQSSRKR